MSTYSNEFFVTGELKMDLPRFSAAPTWQSCPICNRQYSRHSVAAHIQQCERLREQRQQRDAALRQQKSREEDEERRPRFYHQLRKKTEMEESKRQQKERQERDRLEFQQRIDEQQNQQCYSAPRSRTPTITSATRRRQRLVAQNQTDQSQSQSETQNSIQNSNTVRGYDAVSSARRRPPLSFYSTSPILAGDSAATTPMMMRGDEGESRVAAFTYQPPLPFRGSIARCSAGCAPSFSSSSSSSSPARATSARSGKRRGVVCPLMFSEQCDVLKTEAEMILLTMMTEAKIARK